MFKIKFKTIRFVLIAYFMLILQATLINSISIFSVKPEIPLLLVIFFALYNGARAGMFCGMILGLFLDVLSGGIVGINIFILGCAGFSCGLLKERVYTAHLLTKILIPMISCIFSIGFYYIIARHFYRLPLLTDNFGIILGTIAYTTVFNIFFSHVLERLVIVRTTSLL
ncbi:MAG: rod shape-determining protein MreD [Candidatus Omnitrophica bacterium]|nr:rod shape-determining protein MreD [Candidatus Omnitrophota bacterium]